MNRTRKRTRFLAIVLLLPVAAGAQSRVLFGATALRTTRVYSDPTDTVTVAVTGAGLSALRVDADDRFGYFADIGLLYPVRAVAVSGELEEPMGPEEWGFARLVIDALAGPVLVMPLGDLSLIVGPGVHANAVILMARETDPGEYLSISVGVGACAAATWRLGPSLEAGAALRVACDLFEPIRVPRGFIDFEFARGWTASLAIGLAIPR